MSKTPKNNPDKVAVSRVRTDTTPPAAFEEVLSLIHGTKMRAIAAANTALIDLYWQIGEQISRRITADGWGHGTVEELADYIRKRHPNARGFSAQNLWRMRQLYEAYRDRPILSAPLRELTWTHNLLILGKCRREEEREFYLRLACVQKWSSRELERQINSALFERTVLSPPKLSTPLAESHPEAAAAFKKVVEFEPEHLGKLQFYLEALDRDVKKPHEQPSIGVLLCATKNREVVEYALSRSMSPALVSEYQTRLPDKKLLQAKMHEFYDLAQEQASLSAIEDKEPAKPRKRRRQ
jgi:predicted nuclease of restriction endonuclease-like (RecB) superfamily